MSTLIYCNAEKRHDFVYLFDVTDGNPNGDPDNGNLPRVDPETMRGMVSDVSIKRKVRDWVDATHGEKEHYRIYVQNKGIALNDLHKEADEEVQKEAREKQQEKQEKADGNQKRSQEDARREWMCRHFYDVRTFGAVMSTGDYSAGQVRGPVQLTFARSVDPITPLDITITRVAITKSGEDKRTEMGRKALVPYALYLGYGFFTPHFARQAGFSSEDLTLFWTAFQSAWNLDRSASRGLLACRSIYIFSHEHPLGNVHAHRLFERIKVQRRAEIEIPRQFSDYAVLVDDTALPQGVTLTTIEC
ncbi:MAG TPA: type I-C CRISPR-associated protein Cas7/Csd2 [Ktedonobacterales bacterium]|nr:type I-C CRISPR-associated protein Cas7/Csd2 [Ktedonobacterales bacterium]